MGFLRSGTQEVVGLHIDGQLIQAAHLRRQGDQISILGLERATLTKRLDLDQADEKLGAETKPADAGDILGLQDASSRIEAPAPVKAEEDEQVSETNSEILYQLLGGFPLKKCSLAISLMEGCIFFSEFQDTFGLKGKRLKRRLLVETRKERALEVKVPVAERHAFFATERGTLLSIVHEDPLEILNLLDGLKPFIGRVQIALIDPLEIALMNLVRSVYPAEEKVTAVVYVGQGFSKVIFMQNGGYLAFSQPIHEGGNSPQVLNTVYSRILFEQDVSDIPEIGRVLLAGESHRLEALPFFAAQCPDSQVEYLAFPEFDLSSLEEQARSSLSHYAVPVGLAWKALQPKSSSFFPTNFLPQVRKRQQNPFELAWHSLVLLTLLLVSTLLFIWKAQQQSRVSEGLELAIQLTGQQFAESNSYVKLVDDLNGQIQIYERNLALIDTLSAKQVAWSTKLGKWAEDFQAVGSLWLERFSTTEGDVDVRGNWGEVELSIPPKVFMHGKVLEPIQASELAAQVGNGQIRALVRTEIRGKTIYELDLAIPVTAADTTNIPEP